MVRQAGGQDIRPMVEHKLQQRQVPQRSIEEEVRQGYLQRLPAISATMAEAIPPPSNVRISCVSSKTIP